MNPVNPERRDSTEREREIKGDKRRKDLKYLNKQPHISDSVLNPLKMWLIKLSVDFWKSKPTKMAWIKKYS